MLSVIVALGRYPETTEELIQAGAEETVHKISFSALFNHMQPLAQLITSLSHA